MNLPGDGLVGENDLKLEQAFRVDLRGAKLGGYQLQVLGNALDQPAMGLVFDQKTEFMGARVRACTCGVKGDGGVYLTWKGQAIDLIRGYLLLRVMLRDVMCRAAGIYYRLPKTSPIRRICAPTPRSFSSKRSYPRSRW